MQTGS